MLHIRRPTEYWKEYFFRIHPKWKGWRPTDDGRRQKIKSNWRCWGASNRRMRSMDRLTDWSNQMYTFASMTQSTQQLKQGGHEELTNFEYTKKGSTDTSARNHQLESVMQLNSIENAHQINGRRWFIWLHLLVLLFFSFVQIKETKVNTSTTTHNHFGRTQQHFSTKLWTQLNYKRLKDLVGIILLRKTKTKKR